MARICRVGGICLLFLCTGVALGDEARGIISQVDNDKQELTVNLMARRFRRASVVVFALTRDTRVTAGAQPAKLSDLRPGQQAWIEYEIRDGRRLALDINVRSPIGSRLLGEGSPRTGAPPLAPPPRPTSAEPPLAPPLDPNAIAGVLQRVAITDREIVTVGPNPKGDGELESTIGVPESATITKDGKPIKLEGLKEGESVVVHADKKEGKLVASSIQLGQGAPVVAKKASSRKERIEKIRQILRYVDAFLQQRAEQPDESPP
jgi:hypothetical protein